MARMKLSIVTDLDEHILAADYPEDVARLRSILAAAGFEAEDATIAGAYTEFCEDRYFSTWLPLDYWPDEQLLAGLLESLKLEDE